MTTPSSLVDPAFLALPYQLLADAALSRARELGASYADFRGERILSQAISAKDRELQSLQNGETVGFAVRVIVDGGWGFASDVVLSPEAAASTAARAVEVARAFRALNAEPVELATEPSYIDTYVSSFEVNPFNVDDAEKIAFVLNLNERVMAGGLVDHVDSFIQVVQENKYFASLGGSRITQQRVRLASDFTALKVNRDSGAFETMSSTIPPAASGWEYLRDGVDLPRAADEIPTLLQEKFAAPSIQPGLYDLVIDPSQLWLTIHESVGHSTELDRVLGHEATLAGTSFATLDKLNNFQFGSPVMNITGDRVTEHGVGTTGYDDEGVKAQTWDIVRDGVLVGYQLNRQMAAKMNIPRSNGCAFADSPGHIPIQRMPNVTLQPSPQATSLDDLIGGVERGLYVVGNKSWSIDQQRYNFQFSAQKFFEIRGGRLVGQVKDAAYQGNTTDFWNSMEAVGGPETFVLFGTFGCGKGLPGQAAPAGHGCPAALFRGVKVLNTVEEA